MTSSIEGATMQRPPWQAVEFRHLAALSAIAREGSFRGAAESLGYVQSAVSEQIAALEASVGISVLERRRGTAPTALTAAGELLLRHFEEILRCFAAAQADLQELREGRRGPLRIGACESVAVRLLPAIVRELAATIPQVTIELTASGDADQLADLVERGRLDAAFGGLPLPPSSFASRQLLHDPYVLMTPATSPLATASETPTAADLSGLALIGPASAGPDALAETELRAHGIEPRYVLRSDGNATVQALVAAGVGSAIVPRLAADERDERVALLELDSLLPPRSIFLYWQESRLQPALAAFVEAATRCAAAHAAAPRVVSLVA
jgi:molybdate transport repressor ModE-like protein